MWRGIYSGSVDTAFIGMNTDKEKVWKKLKQVDSGYYYPGTDEPIPKEVFDNLVKLNDQVWRDHLAKLRVIKGFKDVS